MESFPRAKKNGLIPKMTDKMSVENEADLQKENLELWKRIAILENDNESLVQRHTSLCRMLNEKWEHEVNILSVRKIVYFPL